VSRGNISGTYPDSSGGTVVFNCRDGEERSYHYAMPDFLEILGGADPASFTPDGGGGVDFAETLLEVQEAGATDTGAITAIGEDIAELGLLGL
jgi:hypothetical protein